MKKYFLQKAEENLPKIYAEKISISADAKVLHSGDSFVLDLGNHHVGYFSFVLGYTDIYPDAPVRLCVKFCVGDPVIPAHKITLHVPATVIHMIAFPQEGKLLPDGADGAATQNDFKSGQQGEEFLMDGADLLACALIINMDLVTQSKDSGTDFVAGFSGFVVDIIAVAPGKDPLLDI